jgi:hypothetical protein
MLEEMQAAAASCSGEEAQAFRFGLGGLGGIIVFAVASMGPVK